MLYKPPCLHLHLGKMHLNAACVYLLLCRVTVLYSVISTDDLHGLDASHGPILNLHSCMYHLLALFSESATNLHNCVLLGHAVLWTACMLLMKEPTIGHCCSAWDVVDGLSRSAA